MLQLCLLQQHEWDDCIAIAKDAWSLAPIVATKQLKELLKIGFHLQSLEAGLFFVLKKDNEIIGTCFAVHRRYDIKNSVDIFHVAIKESFRGKGMGLVMFDFLFKQLIELGRDYAFISCDNDKASFYKKCGMQQFGVIDIDNNAKRVYFYKDLNQK